MPKEKSPQDNDSPITIPPTVINRLEREIQGIDFGGVSLIITIRDSHPTFRIEKTVSVMTGV
jgi:hypothetical protein